jgi:hypothetical protein
MDPVTLAVVMSLGGAQAAETPRRFDLACREFADAGILRDRVDRRFSIDLDAATACREGIGTCAPVVDHGRWLELSYGFRDGEDDWQMFRLYDCQTGWLDQVIRRVGEHGLDYGDAVCTVAPGPGSARAADKTGASR